MTELAADFLIAGRYRVVRLIGKGGMGAVYEVEHLHTGQHLALKVLTTHQQGTAIERFKREARVASRIQSDHIVRVTDADAAPELDGAPFLVMELLEGADLEHATASGPAPRADVVEWLRQVARALGKAHEAGIVHRDLKPENLFLTRREDGTPLVKILDFGIAKMAADAGPLTHSGQFLGTPQYMAPEQTDSHGDVVTAQADVWALGLIAFRLLEGRSYWKPGNLAQLLAQILAEPIVPPSERGSALGAELDTWFLRSCERQPGKRFTSAVEQVEALAAALGLPRQERAPTPTPTLASAPEGSVKTFESAPTLDASSRELTTARVRRGARRWMIGGGAVAVGGMLAAALLGGRGHPADPPMAPAASPAASPVVAAVAAPVAPLASPAAASVALDVVDASIAPRRPDLAPALPTRTAPRPAFPRRADAGAARDPLEGQY
jgi:serine/threonine protein kinase